MIFIAVQKHSIYPRTKSLKHILGNRRGEDDTLCVSERLSKHAIFVFGNQPSG